MKSEKNILFAFLLNLLFSIFELIGGFITGSVAILSDALHDFSDAASIGCSYFLERKSLKSPDSTYTYGYRRYSVLGGFITSFILVCGSVTVIVNAVLRIVYPTQIKHDSMIIFAVLGIIINISAAVFTHHGDSINQKAVNLHMLEDALGWIVVLVGAVVIKYTNLVIIDPIMSIGVAVFIFVNAIKNLKEILDLFLEKAPKGIYTDELRDHICEIDGVIDAHHIHVWSIDGHSNFATMHVITDGNSAFIKQAIKKELFEHGIFHTTIEIESSTEECKEKNCHIEHTHTDSCHHHHHH